MPLFIVFVYMITGFSKPQKSKVFLILITTSFSFFEKRACLRINRIPYTFGNQPMTVLYFNFGGLFSQSKGLITCFNLCNYNLSRSKSTFEVYEVL